MKYVTLDGDTWLIMTAIGREEDAAVVEAYASAAKSLRRAQGEPRIDPISVAALIPLLGRDRDRVLLLLRARMPAAETEIAQAILDSKDHFGRIALAELLKSSADEKAVPQLQEIAKVDNDELANIARATLRRIQPTKFDAVTEALEEIKGTTGGTGPRHWSRSPAPRRTAAGRTLRRRWRTCSCRIERRLSRTRSAMRWRFGGGTRRRHASCRCCRRGRIAASTVR